MRDKQISSPENNAPVMRRSTLSTALMIGALVAIGVYCWNLGVNNIICTAMLIGLCSAAIFRKRFWRFCASAWVRYRSDAKWAGLANWAFVTCALHAVLIQIQSHGIIPQDGVIGLGSYLVTLEGAIHLTLANPAPVWLAWFGLIVYTCGFPALMLSMIIILDGCQEERLLSIFLRACIGVSLLALPVFAIVGVPEVWYMLDGYTPPAVDPGDKLEFYRTLSGLYNCFPSLHCTLTLIAMGTAWRSRMPSLRWLVLPLGSLICLSTIFNGIHWVVDVASSIPIAAVAYAAAVRVQDHTPVEETP